MGAWCQVQCVPDVLQWSQGVERGPHNYQRAGRNYHRDWSWASAGPGSRPYRPRLRRYENPLRTLADDRWWEPLACRHDAFANASAAVIAACCTSWLSFMAVT